MKTSQGCHCVTAEIEQATKYVRWTLRVEAKTRQGVRTSVAFVKSAFRWWKWDDRDERVITATEAQTFHMDLMEASR